MKSVRDADARREIVTVDLYQSAVLQRSALGEDQPSGAAVGGGIEIRQFVFAFQGGRREIVAQTEVQG